jgi:glycogen synthase
LKRIALFSKVWRSGTGLYAQGLARGIAAAGHDLIFIAPIGDPLEVADSAPAIRRIAPVREYVMTHRASRPVRIARSLRRIAEGSAGLLRARLATSRFVVTIPEPLPIWLTQLILLRASGAQVIFVCHDPEPHAWSLPSWLRWLERGALSLSYRLASQIVVLSSAGKVALTDRFDIPAERIHVVPHGAFDVAPAGPLPGNRRLLLFGTIRRNKNVIAAIKAVAGLRSCGVHLVVAGGPDANDSAYVDECRALAAELPESVALEVGYIEDERVAALMADSDALLLPYTNFDSQSGVAVLAGMVGRPVVCAAAGGIPDLIKGGLAAEIIQPPGGVEQITAGIKRFLDEPPEQWTAKAVAGREMLCRELDWCRVGSMFGKLFD